MDDFFDLSPTGETPSKEITSRDIGKATPQWNKNENSFQLGSNFKCSEEAKRNVHPTAEYQTSDALSNQHPKDISNSELPQERVKESRNNSPLSVQEKLDESNSVSSRQSEYSTEEKSCTRSQLSEVHSSSETSSSGRTTSRAPSTSKENKHNETEERKGRIEERRDRVTIKETEKLDPWENWYLDKYKKEIEKIQKKRNEIKLSEEKIKNKKQKDREKNKREVQKWMESKTKLEREKTRRKQEKLEEAQKLVSEKKNKNEMAFKEWLKKHPSPTATVRLACASLSFRKVYYKDGTTPPPPSVVNHKPWLGAT